MYDNFTEKARKIMQLATEQAHILNHQYIGTEHILLGCIAAMSGAYELLRGLCVDNDGLRSGILSSIQPGPIALGADRVLVLPNVPRVQKVIDYANEEARSVGQNRVNEKHLLLGLIRETEGLAAIKLREVGVTLESAREACL